MGIVAAMMGLATAELVAAASRGLRSPVLDVGDRVIDRTPVAVKDFAIAWFGTNDKIALLVGIGVLLALYAATLGVLALRGRTKLALAGCALFGLAGTWAALGSRGDASSFAPLPSVLGAAVAGAALVGLAILHHRDLEAAAAAPGQTRRHFLVGVGGVTLGAVAIGTAGRWLSARFNAAASRAGVTLPTAREPLGEVPSGAQADGAAPLFTSNADFYRIDTALSLPQVPAESWRLRVSGMVERELDLSYEDLLSRPIVEADITLTCVSNTVGGELIGTARWLGVRLDDLLDEAGIAPGSDQVVGRSVDGYSCGFPVAALDGRDALVAVGMNDEPLPIEHGFPARLIVPGIYGYASATKWLDEIELTTFDAFDHYWVPRGYAAQAPIKLQSRIDTPRGLDKIPPGEFVVGGVAWAQTIGIEQVEVKVDDGPWEPAQLATEVNDTTWRQWSFPWDATPGRHSISARATDRNGLVQTDERVEPLPDGATGHHTVVVLVEAE